MEKTKFSNDELEEFEYIIAEIEHSFKIKFEDKELLHLNSIDELCTFVIDKIDLEDVDTCTTQRAFYNFRSAVVKLNLADREDISPSTKLSDILPRKGRLKIVQAIEKELGLKINVFSPSMGMVCAVLISFLVSLVSSFFFWQISLGAISLFIILCIAMSRSNHLGYKTVGSFIEDFAFANYVEVRSDSGSVNKKEMREMLIGRFSTAVGIEREKLLVMSFS